MGASQSAACCSKAAASNLDAARPLEAAGEEAVSVDQTDAPGADVKQIAALPGLAEEPEQATEEVEAKQAADPDPSAGAAADAAEAPDTSHKDIAQEAAVPSAPSPEAKEGAEAAAAAAAPAPVPQLTKEQAKEALDKAIGVIALPDNMETVKAAITAARASSEDPMQQQLAMMTKVLPAVQGMLAKEMEEYGFNAQNMMMGIMQIQMHSAGDADMTAKVQKIMSALQGKFDEEPQADAAAAPEAKEEAAEPAPAEPEKKDEAEQAAPAEGEAAAAEPAKADEKVAVKTSKTTGEGKAKAKSKAPARKSTKDGKAAEPTKAKAPAKKDEAKKEEPKKEEPKGENPDEPKKDLEAIWKAMSKEEQDDKGEKLRDLAGKGSFTLVSGMLEAGVFVDAKHKDGFTALHMAAENGHKDVVEVLLKYKADCMATLVRGEWGMTPLHMAARKGHKDVTKMLVKKGKKALKAKNYKGKTPMEIAEGAALDYLEDL